MKTKNQKVAGKISAWALPKAHELEEGEDPFEYELSTTSYHHWRTGAICLHTVDVTVEVPEGIDMRKRAIETLEAKQQELKDKLKEEVADIQASIQKLLCIGYDV